jgi:acyl-CoA synthetase (AMP-forming)/AMP-acid ligase II
VTEFNVARVFRTVAEAVGERDCIIWRDRRLTYADVLDRTDRLAAYLASQGLGVHSERHSLPNHLSGQDHLGIYLYNGNEYLETMIGCFRARVAPFNVNYRYVHDELLYLLTDAKVRALVYHSSFAPAIAEIRAKLPELSVLIQVRDESGNPLLPGAVDYEEAIASQAGPPDCEPSPDDLYILYTGGTTGMPKGVLWRQHDIFMAAMGGKKITTWEVVESYEQIAADASRGSALRSMPLPPLMHGAAQWMSFMGLTAGGTVVMPDVTERLDPESAWQAIEKHRVNIVAVVGDAMARPLIEHLEERRKRGDPPDVSSLLAIGNGGAPLNAATKERILAALPNIVVSDSVGSSETGAQGSHISTASAVQTGRFVPSPGAVVLSESLDSVLEPGHEGIGWFAQTGWVPLGYLGDPAKTERTFPVIDGIRYSVPGDRARHGADGTIELLGRDAVTINSGGEKIFAEEVELAIGSHPAVADVVVVGRPSERWGEEVVALVAVQDGSAVTQDELVEHASRSIARYKLPKEVVFLPGIVRSPAGKADYRWARQQALKASEQARAALS